MEQIMNQLINQSGNLVEHLTGFSIPPIILVIALIMAIVKGFKTLTKIVCVLLTLYVIFLLYQAGMIPHFDLHMI